MKILFVQESDWLKRNAHQQHHLAELMSLRGHEVRVIDYDIMHNIGFYEKRAVYSDVTKIYNGAGVMLIRPSIIKLPGLDYLSLLWTHYREIRRQLKEFQPDVIVGWSILNSYMASRIKHVPFVYYWIDELHELIPFAPFKIIGKMVEARTLRNASSVIAINKALGECVNRVGGQRCEAEVLGAGVNFQQFDSSISGKEIRESFGIKGDDVVLLFMGWLYIFSGLAEVFRGLAKAGDTRIKIFVVGDGDAYGSLSGLVQELHMWDRIFLVGRKPYSQMPQYVAASDICILPAYAREKAMRNIVPIKVYEYLAMGKPVIVTELSGVMAEFGDDSGIVYVGKPEDVVSEALRLVQSGKLEELGKKAHEAVRKFSWDNIADRFVEILMSTDKEKSDGRF